MSWNFTILSPKTHGAVLTNDEKTAFKNAKLNDYENDYLNVSVGNNK